MLLFAVIPFGKEAMDALRSTIDSIEPENRYELPENSGWLVSFKGTGRQLCSKLKVETSSIPVIIIPMKVHYGFGPTDMWEWIELVTGH